jgi:TldD protein
VKDRLVSALKKSSADYTEVRFEINDSNSITFRGQEIDSVSSSKLSGGIVRACTRGGWGMAVFDSLEDLENGIREAGEGAALVGREKTELAETAGPANAEVPARLERDFRGVSLDDKIKILSGYNTILLKTDKSIATTQATYGDSFRTVHFASSRGNYFREERPRVILALSAVARDGALVQRAYDAVSSKTTFNVVQGLEALAEETARRAVKLLKAPPCPGGVYPVVLDQEMGGVFAHEAFGHLSESDFLYENPQVRDLMVIGREMGVKELNIVDDGSHPGLLGTQAFDDEGTPTGKTYLIREGKLVGHLHSLETAAKMGEKPTGNARAIGRGVPPIVRMTNTYIEAGKMSFKELLAGVDRGIYARGMMGGQTMMEVFTFSAAYGYRIENGQVGELVRDVVLTGNVFQTLHNIDGFGNDLKILQKGGGCGKGGQSPLPVTDGAPHLRIRDVVIGGK